jgi:hypothetical protein
MYVYNQNLYNQVPSVTLDANFINFGLATLGNSVYKTFNITNNSNSKLAFQVILFFIGPQ